MRWTLGSVFRDTSTVIEAAHAMFADSPRYTSPSAGSGCIDGCANPTPSCKQLGYALPYDRHTRCLHPDGSACPDFREHIAPALSPQVCREVVIDLAPVREREVKDYLARCLSYAKEKGPLPVKEGAHILSCDTADFDAEKAQACAEWVLEFVNWTEPWKLLRGRPRKKEASDVQG
jgi:hypothetical protein